MLTFNDLENIMLKKLLAKAEMKAVINDLRWQNYIKTKHLTLGIKTAIQRQLAKEGFDELNTLSLEEQLNILSELFQHSQIFEIKNQCLMFLDQRKKKHLKLIHWNTLKEWVKYVDNWAHSDGLSSIYTLMLKDNQYIIYAQLVKWNKSKNHWERRQSVVCLFYYSNTRKKFLPFEESIYLITHLLNDQEYYVQKGIGWALREASNVYYEYTYDFILQHAQQLKPAAYSAAIEKLEERHKEQVKLLRKKKSTF